MTRFHRCVFLLADGARWDVFDRLLSTGALPHISKHVVSPGALRKATSVFPSTTGPAHLPFLTGRGPGECDIPGIRWFDPREYAKKGPLGLRSLRSYVGPGAHLLDSDLPASIQTLFQFFKKPACVFSPITRGLPRRTQLRRDVLWLLAHWTSRWDIPDAAVAELVDKAIGRGCDLVYAVIPGIDELAHLSGPFSPRTTEGYRRLDETVGQVAAGLEERGMLESTLFVVASDHGLTPTARHFDPGSLLEKCGHPTVQYPNIFRRSASAAYMVSGNAMGHIYFSSDGSWGPPVFTEAIQSVHGDVYAGLLGTDEVDLLISRDRDGTCRVASRKGEARIIHHGSSFTYDPVSGDPLGYGDLAPRVGEHEAHQLTVDSEYCDALVQIVQLFRSRRTGHLIVTAKAGSDLRAKDLESPHHRASHGSLLREHMLVPLAANMPMEDAAIRNTDVFDLILSATGHRPDRLFRVTERQLG